MIKFFRPALLTLFFAPLFFQGHSQNPCLIPVNIPLDSLVDLSVERYAPGLSQKKRDERIGSYTLNKLERFKIAINEEPLDSLFRFSRQYLTERLGQDMFCRRVRVRPHSFGYWRGEVEFEFYFYFKDDIKENRSASKIRFKFKKQKSGRYEFTPPTNIPPCSEKPEKCEFNFLSLMEIMDTVQTLGILDIATPYDIGKNSDNYEIVIRTPGGDGFERQIKIDMRDGSISEDSLEVGRYYQALASIDQAKKASLVVEAQRIKKTKGYSAYGGYVHTSHIFKINKVFKGEIDRDTFEVPQIGGELNGTFTSVSHSLHIPSKGIFFLEDLQNPKLYNSEDSIYNYPKKYNGGLPLDYSHIGNDVPPYWAMNIEGYLYPKLEEYTGQQYREVSASTVTDTVVVGWLKEIALDKAPELITEKGLLLGLWRTELDAENNRLEVFVAGSTSHSFSYPTKMNFKIGYNPDAFGDGIAAKGLVEINRNISRSGMEGGLQPMAFFPEYYEYSVKDSGLGILEFTFEKTGNGTNPPQLLARPDGRPIHYNELLFSFFIPITSDSARVGLRLLNEPFSDGFIHYDHLEKMEKPYAFVHTSGALDYPASDKIMPVISGIKADTVKAGSKTVVDVWGKNFLQERTVVALRCEQVVNSTTYTRYCRIPKKNYTYRSASHVKFTVPETMYSSSWLDKMKPVTGTVYVINLVGDEDKLVESEKVLNIVR